MVLTAEDLRALADWRRALHREPELSGAEAETAREVCRFLDPTRPDRIVTGLGGHGVAFVYDGAASGPTVLIRAELDALPIEEVSTFAHRSTRAGRAHLCGHDGHMAILAAVAHGLAAERPRTRPRRAPVSAGGGGRQRGRGGDRRSEVRGDRSRTFASPCTTCRACRWRSARSRSGRSPALRAASGSPFAAGPRTPASRIRGCRRWPRSPG